MLLLRFLSPHSRRQTYKFWERWLWTLCILTICLSSLLLYNEKLQLQSTLINLVKKSSEWTTIITRSIEIIFYSDWDLFSFFQIEPRFLILGINDRRQSMCKPVYEEIVPKLESLNISDEDFVQAFVGKYFNPSYIAHLNTNATMANMTTEYCSNRTHQWILLSVSHQSIFILVSLVQWNEVFFWMSL